MGRNADGGSDEWQMVSEWVLTGNGLMDAHVNSASGGDVTIMFPLAIQSANPFADKTVLVVDDGEGLPDIVETHLHPLGVRVLKAANAEQALIVQRDNLQAIDFLLTHAAMPEMNGVRLAEMLVAENPNLRVVYMTNPADSETPQDAAIAALLKSAITLPKPLSLRKLSTTLEKALQHVQQMDENLP